MLCHPEPFRKCCDTEPLCFSDTLVPKDPLGSQDENVSLSIQPTACQDSSVWRHLAGKVRDISHSYFVFLWLMYFPLRPQRNAPLGTKL